MYQARAKLKKELRQDDGMFEFTFNGNKAVTDKSWVEWKEETMTSILNKVDAKQFIELHVIKTYGSNDMLHVDGDRPPRLQRGEEIPSSGSKTSYLQIN